MQLSHVHGVGRAEVPIQRCAASQRRSQRLDLRYSNLMRLRECFLTRLGLNATVSRRFRKTLIDTCTFRERGFVLLSLLAERRTCGGCNRRGAGDGIAGRGLDGTLFVVERFCLQRFGAIARVAATSLRRPFPKGQTQRFPARSRASLYELGSIALLRLYRGRQRRTGEAISRDGHREVPKQHIVSRE